eukprot:CAMPEP_0172491006 /NCGR_PEP_ID=MMETSP1066-20121228/21662_1 /TAXON_ID=671091 /ORGANISM="Coscinodiscus wailesii, Strain CCMP2513" /LENGTH=111 /DNA_ID=CAMNT_0013259789 /DNA_START=864 /DNA_END=1200 /DNA_ORIENTATION=+
MRFPGVRYLKLLYLGEETAGDEGWYCELDMGERMEEKDLMLWDVYEDLSWVWNDINASVDKQDPTLWTGYEKNGAFVIEARTNLLKGLFGKGNPDDDHYSQWQNLHHTATT